MTIVTRFAGSAIAILLAASGAFLTPGFLGTDMSGQARASAQEKSQTRQSHDNYAMYSPDATFDTASRTNLSKRKKLP